MGAQPRYLFRLIFSRSRFSKKRTVPALVTFRTLFGFFETVRLALDGNHFRAMDESIDERYDAPCAWEDLLPLGELLIGGNDGAHLFVAAVEQFESSRRHRS
jgi:hypothetical protein